MASAVWKRLLDSVAEVRRPGGFPIPAYSEFMPPPRLVRKPYGAEERLPFRADDPDGWHISEYEEAFELQPGLDHLATELLRAIEHLGHGRPAHGIARAKLEGNPYWPPELADRAGMLDHERYVVLAPLALARTQDDKGRVRWTLFGGSEQGPARAFWKGFWTAPDRELPAETALSFLCRLIHAAFGERPAWDNLRGAGLRILPGIGDPSLPYAEEERLPSWAAPLVMSDRERLSGVKHLLTFRPFGSLPPRVRRAYLAGDLNLLPFPGSLVFWGTRPFLELRRQLPLAMQIPLLQVFPRRESPLGLRVPQAGWMHEPHPDQPTPDPERIPLRNTFRRTHRWARIHRHEDELGVADGEDRVAHVLFSTAPDDLGLYGKPMARNAQIWTDDFRLLLDGPRADRKKLQRAAAALQEGGHFGYRFQYPAMRVGRYEVYWHRPLIAFLSRKTGEPEVLPGGPLGYLTAYRADRPNPARAMEFWPRLLAREPYVAAIESFAAAEDHHRRRIALGNARNLLDASQLLGGGGAGGTPAAQSPQLLASSFAEALLDLPKHAGPADSSPETLDDWLAHLETAASDRAAGRRLAAHLRGRIELSTASPPAGKRGTVPICAQHPPGRSGKWELSPFSPLTLHRTARRSFEVAYWRTIRDLAHGRYINKDNADCVRDPATQRLLRHPRRDLEALGNYLLAYYRRVIEKAAMSGRVAVGDLPFRWQTDFGFPWSGGWLSNQGEAAEERDLMVVIPGRDRRRAVVMADHYDTAYMEDCYEKARGGSGARLAAAGADDNHSATAALMLAAPIFMELSRAGRLGCDIWLVHLTGEEFPSDCMGARHLAEGVVEGTLKLRRWKKGTGPVCRNGPEGAAHKLDLSPFSARPLDLAAEIRGVYVSDMIAHNNDHDRDVFQISPGTGAASLRLAEEAHAANMLWNAGAMKWNQAPQRRHADRSKRTKDPHGRAIPDVARFLGLRGEVRPPSDPRSSLYNTDGQIFSDAGIPVVLFMENYDINRQGYHDTHDTMANIDLDYGAALAAIAIESVARAAGAT